MYVSDSRECSILSSGCDWYDCLRARGVSQRRALICATGSCIAFGATAISIVVSGFFAGFAYDKHLTESCANRYVSHHANSTMDQALDACDNDGYAMLGFLACGGVVAIGTGLLCGARMAIEAIAGRCLRRSYQPIN